MNNTGSRLRGLLATLTLSFIVKCPPSHHLFQVAILTSLFKVATLTLHNFYRWPTDIPF